LLSVCVDASSGMATGTEIKQAEAGRKSGVRTRIIDAAWDLGHTETPTKLTVRNIAMRAGVSPAHLYTYFDSKTELVQELQRRAAPRLLSALADALDGAETPAEQLLRTCLAYVGFARDHRWLCVGANCYHEHDASSLSDTSTQRLAALLETHDVPPKAPMLVRVAINGLVADDRLVEDVDGERELFAESYVRMLLRGVSVSAPNSSSPSL
jgi:AcrR family transcriptional regulator